MSRRLRKVTVPIPEQFLHEFDQKTKGFYASRNEAIRAGMILLLETHRKKRGG